MITKYIMFYKDNSVFLFPIIIFFPDFSVRQRNYHVIHSRIISLHTSQKWDFAIIAVSSVVTEKTPNPVFENKQNYIVNDYQKVGGHLKNISF